MKKMRKIVAILLAVLTLSAMTTAFAANTASQAVTVPVTGTQDYAMAYQVLDIVNAERAAANLPALTMDVDLLNTAMQRAAECSVYYSHTRPDGSTCFTAFPSKFSKGWSGENIAVGYDSAEDVMTGWMNSKGHRDNILKTQFTTIGIGCFYQGDYIYWTQVFSSVKATKPTSVPANSKTTAKVTALTENLELSMELVPTGKGDEHQIVITNTNKMFEYDTVTVSANDLTYSTTGARTASISGAGVINSIPTVITTINCYSGSTVLCSMQVGTEQPQPEAKRGDINADGVVSNTDIVILSRYLVGIETSIDSAAADVNSDGKVNNADLTDLSRLVVGMN